MLYIFYLFIYLILKSYTKYKIDRDRTIAHNTDKNREEKDKNQRKKHKAHVPHCSWDTYAKDNVVYIIMKKVYIIMNKVKKIFNKFPEISGKIRINFRKFPNSQP